VLKSLTPDLAASVESLSADLLTIPGAARLLGLHPDTAYRLARTGQFPGGAALQIGHKWVVSVPRLRRYLHGDTENWDGGTR
jgi:hypothetical protein